MEFRLNAPAQTAAPSSRNKARLELDGLRRSFGAYNALDEYENWMRNKLTPLPPMIKRTEDPDFQRWYGLPQRRSAPLRPPS